MALSEDGCPKVWVVTSDLCQQQAAYGAGIALRDLFIIDKEGVIQHSTINNHAIGQSVDETMRTLQALQYVQDNPDEVCPAGWKPGEKSMKPDPKGSKEYFSTIWIVVRFLFVCTR